MKIRSRIPFFFTAAITPQTIPITQAITAASRASFTVFGKAAPISSVTGLFSV